MCPYGRRSNTMGRVRIVASRMPTGTPSLSATSHKRSGRPMCPRRVLRICQPLRERHRLVPELLAREDAVQEAPFERLLRGQHAARGHEVDRTALADQPREPLRAAGARQDAERDLREADPPGT